MTETQNTPQIGRNEPCPCGSGKKYKRCCGVSAAPKLSAPSNTQPAFDSSQLPQYDPQMMTQFAQAFQRLPKGQLQRLQSIMQKAMSGKDVTREAAELEASLPPDFQEMLKGFQMPGMPNAEVSEAGAGGQTPTPPSTGGEAPVMTEEEARALVAKAASEGKISQDQAETLLKPAEGSDSKGGIGKLFRKIGGKKD